MGREFRFMGFVKKNGAYREGKARGELRSAVALSTVWRM